MNTLEKLVEIKEEGIRETDSRFFVDGVDVTEITEVIKPYFISIMGKVGRKSFHLYALKKEDKWAGLHGVTSILKIINKPMLIGWAVGVACDHILENFPSVEQVMANPKAITELVEVARGLHNKRKTDAGKAGTDVHTQVEKIVKNAIEKCGGYICEVDKECDNAQIKLFIAWAMENSIKFIESEKCVYSIESHYAGTCDLVLEMNGKKYIADIKTSSAIYPEAFLQMAAYQGALEEMNEHLDIKGAMVINLPKRGGFEIGMNYAYDDNRMAFLAALILFKQLNSLTK